MTREVPITILGIPGPLLNAYISFMEYHNIRPKQILLILSPLPNNLIRKCINIFSVNFKRKFLYDYHNKIQNYWPLFIMKKHNLLYDNILTHLSNYSSEIPSVIKSMYSNNFEQKCKILFFSGIQDPKLPKYLKDTNNSYILYTGGGKVPNSLLEIKNVKILHTHPGFLPDFRGGDCFLWSVLLKNQPGMSCFFMSNQIDHGNLLKTKYLPPLNIKIDEEVNISTLYRALFSFIDPVLRAKFFIEEILLPLESLNEKLKNSYSQSRSSGTSYYFMTDKIKKLALNKLFLQKNCIN